MGGGGWVGGTAGGEINKYICGGHRHQRQRRRISELSLSMTKYVVCQDGFHENRVVGRKQFVGLSKWMVSEILRTASRFVASKATQQLQYQSMQQGLRQRQQLQWTSKRAQPVAQTAGVTSWVTETTEVTEVVTYSSIYRRRSPRHWMPPN